MSFPLPVFPTIPDDLESMDSRISIRYLNTFMKNTLIRGMNAAYEAALVIDATQSTFLPFLEYTLGVCDMLTLHVKGDEVFFTRPDAQGKALVDILGADCNPNNSNQLCDAMTQLRHNAVAWREDPACYTMADMLSSLGNLGSIVLQSMQKQLNTMDQCLLRNAVADEKFRDMIQNNLSWLATNSDISFLLLFVLSHHDPSTSVYWPAVTAEGLKVVPELVKEHTACWQFAPFNPVTRESNLKRF